MKKIIIVQSNPLVLPLVQKTIQSTFPKLIEAVSYQSNFEKTLNEIPKKGELVVITSDMFYDTDNVRFPAKEKNSSKLAEEIKKINPAAKVYVFSMYKPKPEFIDGFYAKSQGSDNTLKEIVAIFWDLGLDKETTPPEKVDKKVIKLSFISKDDLEIICGLLELTFLRAKNLDESIRVYLQDFNDELVIKDSGEIFIWRNNMPEDNIDVVNTVPVVLYLQSRDLIVSESTKILKTTK
jgi:hypothetical protein